MKRLIALAALALLASSCVSTKRLTYLQAPEDAPASYDTTTFALQRENYRVQPNDILSITVRTFDPEAAQVFNLGGQAGAVNTLVAGDILFYLQGYSIDLEGNIEMPVIGRVSVYGKTVSEINNLIQSKLDRYFKEEAAFVTVQLAGVRYSVVGDVARPGRYVIYQNQVNIFEALAQAGDITIIGDRKEVMILRQSPQGVRTFRLDLTDRNVISNPHYFIQPNDIINIQPLPQKSLGIGTTGFQTFAQLFGILASAATLAIAISR